MKEKYTCQCCGKAFGNYGEIIRINRFYCFLAEPCVSIGQPSHYVLCGDCDAAIRQFIQCKKKKSKERETE